MSSASSPRRLVFVLAGQSNMAGRGPLIGASPTMAADPRIANFSQVADAWEAPAAHPLHADKPAKAGVGPGLAFAHELLRLAPQRAVSIGLVPCAFGGSELARWEEGGDLFGDAVARVQRSLGSKDGGCDNELAGLLWHQGESDSSDVSSAASHASRMASALQCLRAALSSPALPIVVGELGYFLDAADERFAHAATVNAGLVALPTALPACVCVSAHGLAHRGDRLHFGSGAADELGRRYAHGWLQLTTGEEAAAALPCPPLPPCGFPADASARDAFAAGATEGAVVD